MPSTPLKIAPKPTRVPRARGLPSSVGMLGRLGASKGGLSPIQKADVLLEALPYLKTFRGKTVVVKYGGSALGDPFQRRSVLEDLTFLSMAGIRPVLVHGGGPEISKAMIKQGKPARFVQGLRVTDSATLKTVVKSLTAINRSLVKELCHLGARAQGLFPSEGGIFRVERYTIPGEDLGRVGTVTGVNVGPVQRLLVLGVIPVVVPVGVGWDHSLFNINADEAASALATGLKAEKLVLLTDVPGILRRRGQGQSLISTLSILEAQRLIQEGIIWGGMIPKVKACIRALKSGVGKTHMIDGQIPHGLLLEIFTDRGIGTEIIKR